MITLIISFLSHTDKNCAAFLYFRSILDSKLKNVNHQFSFQAAKNYAAFFLGFKAAALRTQYPEFAYLWPRVGIFKFQPKIFPSSSKDFFVQQSTVGVGKENQIFYGALHNGHNFQEVQVIIRCIFGSIYIFEAIFSECFGPFLAHPQGHFRSISIHFNVHFRFVKNPFFTSFNIADFVRCAQYESKILSPLFPHFSTSKML